MTTWNDVIAEVRASIGGQGLEQDAISWLTTPINDSTLAIQIAATDSMRIGIVEVDNEVMRVVKVDQNVKTLTIAPGGRGWRGSTPISHVANTIVTFNPRFPRLRVKRALASTVGALWPDVWQLKETLLVWNAFTLSYPVPADAEKILDVSWQAIGTTKEWVPARRWRFDHHADLTLFPTGKSLTIYDGMTLGTNVQVSYQATFNVPLTDDSPIASGGMDDSMIELLLAGAAWRLISPLDAAGIAPQSASADILDQARPSGSGAAASRALMQTYQNLLEDFRRSLQTSLPTRAHRTLR